MKKDIETQTKTLEISEINKQIEGLLNGTSVDSIETLLKSNDVETLHTLFDKMDKSKLLHLQALIRAKKETENAVKEAKRDRESINHYVITIAVLGLMSSCIFWAFSDKIMYALGSYKLLTGVVFCSSAFLASSFTSLYYKVKQLINELQYN